MPIPILMIKTLNQDTESTDKETIAAMQRLATASVAEKLCKKFPQLRGKLSNYSEVYSRLSCNLKHSALRTEK